MHPISVVSERTGLTADLLRMWERRYGVVTPSRDEGGRRLYSDADIERLRLLAQATAAGRSVGQLVGLSPGELRDVVRGDEAARWQAARAPEAAAGETEFVARALEHTQALDGTRLELELRRATTVLGAGRFLEGVVAPLFREIGDAWHAGRISIAQEHLASGVARPLLAELRATLPAGSSAPVLVAATPAGETHEIGALLAGGVAALAGWRVTYLGADLPAEEIARAVTATGASAVALSCVDPSNATRALAEIRHVRSLLPDGVRVLVGGAAAPAAGSAPGITLLPDLAALRQALA
jgi:DNA-binding transcriptional MerR regulator/methylmalonyl-CoA mutase cobalamin-binding subunit